MTISLTLRPTKPLHTIDPGQVIYWNTRYFIITNHRINEKLQVVDLSNGECAWFDLSEHGLVLDCKLTQATPTDDN